MDDPNRPYEVKDIAGVCYVAVNLMIDKMIDPIIQGEARAAIVRDFVAEAQRIYNSTEGHRKMQLQLQYGGLPQSWSVRFDPPLVPGKSEAHDYGDGLPLDPEIPDFCPKFG